MPHVIYGIHAVEEAVKSRARALDYVGVARERSHDARVERVLETARSLGVQVRTIPREQIAKLARTDLHQGLVAVGGKFGYTDVTDLLEDVDSAFGRLTRVRIPGTLPGSPPVWTDATHEPGADRPVW